MNVPSRLLDALHQAQAQGGSPPLLIHISTDQTSRHERGLPARKLHAYGLAECPYPKCLCCAVRQSCQTRLETSGSRGTSRRPSNPPLAGCRLQPPPQLLLTMRKAKTRKSSWNLCAGCAKMMPRRTLNLGMTLNLSRNGIGEAGALAGALRGKNTTMTTLTLGDNNSIGEAGVQALAGVLARGSSSAGRKGNSLRRPPYSVNTYRC